MTSLPSTTAYSILNLSAYCAALEFLLFNKDSVPCGGKYAFTYEKDRIFYPETVSSCLGLEVSLYPLRRHMRRSWSHLLYDCLRIPWRFIRVLSGQAVLPIRQE